LGKSDGNEHKRHHRGGRGIIPARKAEAQEAELKLRGDVSCKKPEGFATIKDNSSRRRGEGRGKHLRRGGGGSSRTFHLVYLFS